MKAIATKKLTMIAGLGSKGRRYENTRHNAGLLSLQHLASLHKVSFTTKVPRAGKLAEIPEMNLALFWPDCCINSSGKHVKAAMEKFSVDREQLIVLHDCLETKLGTVKFSSTRSLKGHNGLKDVAAALGGGKDFKRIAIGIGRPQARDPVTVNKFVEGPFKPEEWTVLKHESFSEVEREINTIIME